MLQAMYFYLVQIAKKKKKCFQNEILFCQSILQISNPNRLSGQNPHHGAVGENKMWRTEPVAL